MSQKTNILELKRSKTFYFLLIISFGFGLRLWYFPLDVPIANDGFFSFVYSVKTIFDGNLPVGYITTNTGWPYLLSVFFTFFENAEPLQLMNLQRILSVTISVLTIIPAFFIFKRFVNEKLALFGCLLLILEPRMFLISLEGIDYTLFFFMIVLSLSLFLKESKSSIFLSFICIALGSLIRYEAILLLIPFSVIFFVRYRRKNDILKFIGLSITVLLILVPISFLRIDATDDYCYNTILGENCGRDGIFSNLLDRATSINDKVIGIPDTDDPIYNTDSPMIGHFLFLSFTNLFKFLITILIPYFFIFLILSVIKFVKKDNWKMNWKIATIISTTCVTLLPAIYAYGRGIEEYRYVLMAIPLICIVSILGIEYISKIKNDRRIMVLLISIVIITSISFIEIKKIDYQYERESFKISQEIISLSDISNNFDNAKYIKTAQLMDKWPELPEPDEYGKIKETFYKISVKEFDNIESFIIDSEKLGLRYFVVDQNEDLFKELIKNPDKYSFFNLKFDSQEHGYENIFLIYEIDFNEFNENSEYSLDRLN